MSMNSKLFDDLTNSYKSEKQKCVIVNRYVRYDFYPLHCREQKKEIERINMWQKLEELRKQYDLEKTNPKK